ALLENHSERANAHLERAHKLNGQDNQTKVNYAIVLAERGQLQPALNLLENARKQWPDSPHGLYNLALVALAARRYQTVLEAVDALERLWWENPAIAQDYHDEAVTARGLALLELGRISEARAALDAAARHTVHSSKVPATVPVGGSAPTPDASANGGTSEEETIQVVKSQPEESEAAEINVRQLEGKAAEADLLNNLALTEAAQGDTDRAVSRLLAALNIEPGHGRVLNNLGVLAYQQGRLNAAVKYLEAARQVEEHMHRPEPATFNHLGVVLSTLGRLDESLESFQHAGNHERAEFEVFYNLGRAYIEHGKPDKGSEYLKHAFQLNPDHADVHTVLAAAYLLRGKSNLYAQALNHLKRALQLNTQHRIALTDLALARLETNDEASALKVIGQTLKIHPKSAETIYLLALRMMYRGDKEHWAQAAAQFDAAYAQRPDLLTCVYNNALCQYLMGFRDTAAKIFEHVTDNDPSISPAYFMIGMGHAMVDRYSEALAAWQKALKYEPNNSDLLANMGFIYYQRGDFKEASKLYLQAHQAEPTNAEILAALGLCFARAAMMNQAITAFQKSLEINENSPITHSNIGLAYYIVKQVERAIEHWRYVSQLDRSYAEKREEEQQRSYDDSIVAVRPLNWRARTVELAPILPRPHTRLLPGYNARAFRPIITDPALQEVDRLRHELERTDRRFAWMHVRP
ncbi:MAG: tetratricopeptide repeat protein, partial [Armatimonadota bacterium]|nr:tetratricopeptide repeat protein [Armatimonadota bacterium]